MPPTYAGEVAGKPEFLHASIILASFLSLKSVIRLGHLISKTATVDEDEGGGRIWKRILPLPPIDFSCRFYLCHFKTEQFGAKFISLNKVILTLQQLKWKGKERYIEIKKDFCTWEDPLGSCSTSIPPWR